MAATVDELGHRHDRACYWNHLTCGWVCAAPPPTALDETAVVDGVVGVQVAAPEPLPA